jgi:hypothetical protein
MRTLLAMLLLPVVAFAQHRPPSLGWHDGAIVNMPLQGTLANFGAVALTNTTPSGVPLLVQRHSVIGTNGVSYGGQLEPYYNGAVDFSFAVWARPQHAIDTTQRVIVYAYARSFLLMRGGASQSAWRMLFINDDGSVSRYDTRTTSGLGSNVWCHHVVVWRGTLGDGVAGAAKTSWYINGQIVTNTPTTSSTGNLNPSGTSLIVGETAASDLAGFRFYTRTLTAAEARSIYERERQ